MRARAAGPRRPALRSQVPAAQIEHRAHLHQPPHRVGDPCGDLHRPLLGLAGDEVEPGKVLLDLSERAVGSQRPPVRAVTPLRRAGSASPSDTRLPTRRARRSARGDRARTLTLGVVTTRRDAGKGLLGMRIMYCTVPAGSLKHSAPGVGPGGGFDTRESAHRERQRDGTMTPTSSIRWTRLHRRAAEEPEPGGWTMW